GVRRGSRCRYHYFVSGHEGLREGDRFAFSREHADRITSSDVRRQFRDAGDGEIRYMAEGVDSRILDDDPRKVSQEVLDGPQDLTDGPLVTVLLCKGEGVAECVQGMRVRFFEARGPRPPQVDQVRSGPESVAEVSRAGEARVP